MPAKLSDADKKSVRINFSVTQDKAYRLRLLAASVGCKYANDYVSMLVDNVLAENAGLVDALLAAKSKFRQR